MPKTEKKENTGCSRERILCNIDKKIPENTVKMHIKSNLTYHIDRDNMKI